MMNPVGARTPSAMALVALTVLIVLEGLAAARIGFAAHAFQTAVLTLATGWVLAGCGLAAWHLAPASRTGLLLFAAGAASFMGSFSHVGWDLAAAAATWLTWIYVAILGQVLLTQPDGRVRSTIVVVLTVGLYLVALGSPPDAPLPLAAGLALALAVRRAVAGPDPRRGSADAIGLVVAAALAAGPLLEVLAPGLRLNAVALWLATVAGAAVLLAADTIRVAPVLGRVTDIVLRLDPRTPISVAGELRRATGESHARTGVPTG